MAITDSRAIKAARIWLAALVLTAIAVAWSYKTLDVTIATFFAPYSGHVVPWGKNLGGTLILTGEAIIFLTLAITRVTRGSMSPFGKTIAAACVSSISAYAINANVLKVIFGIVPPGLVLGGEPHMLNWLQGTPDSSFPSGHMMLAGAFAGVLMRHYPKSILPLAVALAGAGFLLLAGNFHFLSDVLAGTFGGLTAGFLAAEIWLAHERSQAS